MRKLVYELENGQIVTTYKEMLTWKEKGFKIKEKLVDIETELKGKALFNKVIADRKKAKEKKGE